jgi:hypothetical protein
MSNVTTTDDLVHALRINNAGKMASLGSIAHATRLNAALLRMSDYVEAFQHAHETGDLGECQGIGIAIHSAATTISEAARELDNAVARELAAARYAA